MNSAAGTAKASWIWVALQLVIHKRIYHIFSSSQVIVQYKCQNNHKCPSQISKAQIHVFNLIFFSDQSYSVESIIKGREKQQVVTFKKMETIQLFAE